jgi:hypothetical protein
MNSSDAASVQTVLRDLDPGAQNQDDVNLHWLIFAIDRGYRKEAISRQFKAAHVSEFGTIMRQRNVADFPYTYSHPESPHNVPEFGVPVGMWSVRGVAGKEELTHCTRTYKGFFVLRCLPLVMSFLPFLPSFPSFLFCLHSYPLL